MLVLSYFVYRIQKEYKAVLPTSHPMYNSKSAKSGVIMPYQG